MEEEQITGNEEQIVENEENEQQDQTIEETTQSTYQDVYSEQLELTNHLLAGQIFFLGLIFGVVLFKVFWDRWRI